MWFVALCRPFLWCVCWPVGHHCVVMSSSIFTTRPPARVLGPSTQGKRYIHVVYERNGHEQEHIAPLDRPFPIHVTFPIQSPPASPERGSSPVRSAGLPVVGKAFYSVLVNQNSSS